MLKKVLLALAIVCVGLCALIATRPDKFTIQRSAVIAAAPDKVFPHINDFHKWDAWSPWEKLDPKMQKSYTGAPAGQGAVYDWKGNDDVGTGRMTIVESAAGQKILIKLEFLEPWTAVNDTTFEFKPEGTGTAVTWRMEGKSDFMGKAMGLLMDMDSMIGKDFDQGLANLKGVVEKGG